MPARIARRLEKTSDRRGRRRRLHHFPKTSRAKHRQGKDVLYLSGLDLNSHRAMVRTENLGMDEGVFEPRPQRGGNQEVINAPSDISRARIGHLAPPGVMPAAFLKFPERVE